MTNPANLSGPRHLDDFIMTPNARPPIGTGFAKTHDNPDTTPKRDWLPATNQTAGTSGFIAFEKK
jgi:hypothetical protein